MKILRLYFLDGPLKGESFALDVTVSVGRYRDNDIVLSDEYISRHHARFVPEAGKLVLQDLGSKNGTFVNDRKILMSVVEEGDIVRFGQVNARVEEMRAEEEAEPVPLAPDEQRALAARPNEALRGEWRVDEGFGGCRNIIERRRCEAGVFSDAEHPDFGEVTLFVYYPGLCANDDFRRLAVYEAKRREGRRVDCVPPLFASGLERGLIYLVFERAAGDPLSSRLGSPLPADRVEDMLLAGSGVLLDLSAAGLHHGGMSSDTVFFSEPDLFTFSAFGVLRPDRLNRFRSGDLLLFDVEDLCEAALFALFGGPHEKPPDWAKGMASGLLSTLGERGVPEPLSLLLTKGAAREGKVRYRSFKDFHRDLLAYRRGEGENLAAEIRKEAEAEGKREE